MNHCCFLTVPAWCYLVDSNCRVRDFTKPFSPQESTECTDENILTIGVEKTESEIAVYTRRSQMMQKLLQLLNSAAELSLGPAPEEFITTELPIIEHKPGNITARCADIFSIQVLIHLFCSVFLPLYGVILFFRKIY